MRVRKIPLVSEFLRMYKKCPECPIPSVNYRSTIFSWLHQLTELLRQLLHQLFGNTERFAKVVKVVRVVKVVKSVFNVVNLRFFCRKRYLISELAVLILRLMR